MDRGDFIVRCLVKRRVKIYKKDIEFACCFMLKLFMRGIRKGAEMLI